MLNHCYVVLLANCFKSDHEGPRGGNNDLPHAAFLLFPILAWQSRLYKRQKVHLLGPFKSLVSIKLTLYAVARWLKSVTNDQKNFKLFKSHLTMFNKHILF